MQSSKLGVALLGPRLHGRKGHAPPHPPRAHSSAAVLLMSSLLVQIPEKGLELSDQSVVRHKLFGLLKGPLSVRYSWPLVGTLFANVMTALGFVLACAAPRSPCGRRK